MRECGIEESRRERDRGGNKREKDREYFQFYQNRDRNIKVF